MIKTADQHDVDGWTGQRARPETWPEFDGLPIGIKRVYWDAPYRYTAIAAVEAMWAGLDLRLVARAIRANMADDVRREVRRLYGRTHSQAGVMA